MTIGESDLRPAPVSVRAFLSEDKRTARLEFQGTTDQLWATATDVGSIEALIRELGAVREKMADPVPLDLPAGKHGLAAYDPRWCIGPDDQNRFVVLSLRHPGLGWHCFGFPRNEAGSIAKWLRKGLSITSTRDTLSSSASSFGGDRFLITTEGLGFYYYGAGESRIGPNPFEQIEYDSDRAAGIVAASIVEQRLEEALKSQLREDQPRVLQELFHPSGPLGPFSTKISLAYLLGLLSDDAFKDLVCLKGIRNDFAHKLELDSFDAASIKDRCKNLTVVDRHVGPVPDLSGAPDRRPGPYLGLPDHEVRLADPRFRYVMTAQLIGYRLAECADSSRGTRPFV